MNHMICLFNEKMTINVHYILYKFISSYHLYLMMIQQQLYQHYDHHIEMMYEFDLLLNDSLFLLILMNVENHRFFQEDLDYDDKEDEHHLH